MPRNVLRALIGIVAVSVLGAIPAAQSNSTGPFAGLLSDQPRFDAPFTARATLTVIQRTPGGGKLQRKVTTDHFRDSRGRVRIEYAANADDGMPRTMILLLPNPYAQSDRLFMVDDVEKRVEWFDFVSFQRLFNASLGFSIPTGLKRFTVFPSNVDVPDASGENLGSKIIAGLEVTGVRFDANLSGEVNERWESAALGIVVFARHEDPQTEIEYTLSDVRRVEPDEKLFLMPIAYRYSTGRFVLDSAGAELRRRGFK